MKNIDLERLTNRLAYRFNNLSLLKQALTHRSVGSENYERLEFLGDSVLSFIIANELFNRFPSQSEGELSRLRSYLVREETLADVAKELDLGHFLILGQGELKSGGFRRASILADALEAIIAVIFIDGGIASAKETIINLFRTRLEDPSLKDSIKDAKTQLQEYLQARKQPLPEYQLIHVKGTEHDQEFHITCSVLGIEMKTSAQASTRRKAEQLAAEELLNHLKKI